MPGFMRFAGLIAVLATLGPAASAADVQQFDLVSIPGLYGTSPSISDDGRFVAFQNGYEVYVRDRTLRRTVRASVSDTGFVSETWSRNSRISGDGRYVVFISDRNLVTGEGWLPSSVFVRDLERTRTEHVSVTTSGVRPEGDAFEAAMSADGRFVVFATVAPYVPEDVNKGPDVYLRDRLLGRTELVSIDRAGRPAGFSEGSLSISDNGRYVAFTSYSHELVEQPTPNGASYVRDRLLGKTELVTVNWADQSVGGYGSRISGDGRFVAFTSPFWNMVQGDTNRANDVFVRDRVAGTTERVSVSSSGTQANGPSGSPSLSDDGRFVAFVSAASNLVPGDLDGRPGVFLHDRATGRTELVAPSGAGSRGGGAEITADGRAAAFDTDKALIAEDRDVYWDVYVAQLADPGAVYAFTVKPLSLDFGSQPLGSATVQNFWLRNKGPTALPLLRVFVRGEDAAVFIVAHACGALIAPGTGCAIAVTFIPTVAGPSAAKVVVVAGNRQVRERLVQGIGIQSP